MALAFGSNPLHPGLLTIVHPLLLKRRVVDKNLDRVRARFFQPQRRPTLRQRRQPLRLVGTVPRVLVRQQQALAVDLLCGFQTVFKVEQDRRRLFGERLRDKLLELRHHPRGRLGNAQLPRQHVLQQPSLIHRQRGNHAAAVRDGFRPAIFPGVSCPDAKLIGIFPRVEPTGGSTAHALFYSSAGRLKVYDPSR